MRWYVLRTSMSEEEYVEQVRKNLFETERWRWWVIASCAVWMVACAIFIFSLIPRGFEFFMKTGTGTGVGIEIAAAIFFSGFMIGMAALQVTTFLPMLTIVLSMIPLRTDRLLVKYADELATLRKNPSEANESESQASV